MKKASWIWRQEPAAKNSVTLFRKSFSLPSIPKSALLTVSAHHYFKCWVNGSLVSGICSPASSIFQKHKLSLCYDLKEKLASGENVLAFEVLFLGGDGQNRTRGCAGLYFSLEIELEDGRTLTFVSDKSCRCSGQSDYLPGQPMREARDLTGVTLVDHRRTDPQWKLAGFCDQNWEQAVISPAERLIGELLPQEIPEGAVSARWTPVCLHQAPGFWLFDAGEVLTGFVSLRIRAKAGSRLQLRYGEMLEGERKTWETREEKRRPTAMRVEHSVVNDKSEFYLDGLIAAGGEELWEEDFSYRAFRYFELEGDCELLSIEVCKASTDARCEGYFRCNDELLTRLAEACIRTQKNAIIGALVDCPHREQAQYLGDSLLQSRLLYYNFPDAPALMRKVLLDFADSQALEGYFAWNSPLDLNIHGPHLLRMPEYDLMYPTILYDLWFYAGDRQSVERFYPAAAKMTAYYLSRRDSTGLMPRIPAPCMHISDWPYSLIDDQGDYLFAFNAHLAIALRQMKALAELLELKEDAEYWSEEYGRVKEAVRQNFYQAEMGFFRDTPHSEKHTSAVQALALRAGLFEQNEEKQALDRLAYGPFESRVILSWDVLSLLFEHQISERAYELLADPEVRWGRMMREGSRTIWEGFEDIESHSHAWNAYPLRLMQQYLLGVRCLKPGFAEAEIAPFFPEGLTELEGAVTTPLGLLTAKLCKKEKELWAELELPKGMAVWLVYKGKRIPAASGQLRLPL